MIYGNITPMNISHQAKWLTLLTLLINAAAMLSPVINGGDSITYATLSQHIALNNDWANLVLDGQDWLDKPHMPFWITALFFKIGGVSAFTYILPGFLFHLIGGYYTWRIARLFYGRETAWLSLLVYVSVYHLMDSSIEVKAETYLTGFIMGACYYWLRYDAQAKIQYLLLGALFSACAVMTKGVFTLITITSGLVCMWMYRKQWHKLWSGKWLLALALSLLFTAPEVIALYRQFDMHPEKAGVRADACFRHQVLPVGQPVRALLQYRADQEHQWQSVLFRAGVPVGVPAVGGCVCRGDGFRRAQVLCTRHRRAGAFCVPVRCVLRHLSVVQRHQFSA